MTWLITQFGEWIAIIGAGLALIAGAWLGGRSSGKSAEKAKQDRQRADAIATKMESDREIDDLGPADLDQRFNRWVRPKEHG